MAYNRVYTSSPVLAMSPQIAHQMPFDRPILSRQNSKFNQSFSFPQQLARTNTSGAGRKRSRDEAAVNLDPPERIAEPLVPEDQDEWVYGPGMTLIKKTSNYVAEASSQSGTWVEDKAEAAAAVAQQLAAQERPSLRSNKSQRLDFTNTQLAPADGQSMDRSSPVRELATPMDSIAQPVVDSFTLHLGIGWSRISEEEHIQAAARGWARYIENHFPISNVNIRLESRGLQSYLVEATEGIFLFAENLRQGRLVSQNMDKAFNNLKCSPVAFDSPNTMEATESPRALDPVADPMAAAGAVPDTTMAVAPSIDMEMN